MYCMGGSCFLGVSATRKAKYYFSNDVNLIPFDFNYFQNFSDTYFEGWKESWLAQCIRLEIVRRNFSQAIPQATKRHHAAADPYLPCATLPSS